MDQAALNIIVQLKDGATKAVGNIKGALGSAQDKIVEIGKDAAEMGKKIAVGLGVASAALLAFAKSSTDFTVDYVRSTKQIARETGATTEEASRLVFALKRVGLSTEDASAVFGIFSKNIAENNRKIVENKVTIQGLESQMESTRFKIAEVTKEIRTNGDKTGELGIRLRGLNSDLAELQQKLTNARTPFEKIGVATVDAEGKQRSFRDVLLDVADKFQKMPAGVDKTALSMELFGRSGKDMIGILNKGSQGIEDLGKEADRLGLTLNSKTIAAVDRYIESQKRLKENTDAIKLAVGNLTTPVLAAYNEKLGELIGQFQNLSPGMQAFLANILAFGGPVSGAAASVIGFLSNLSALGPKMLAFVRFATIFTAVATTIAIVVNGIVKEMGGWGVVLKKVQPLLDRVRGVMQDLGKAAQAGLKLAADSMDDLYQAIRLIATGDFQGGIFGLTEDHPAIAAMLHAHAVIKALGDGIVQLATFIGSLLGPALQIGINIFNLLWPSVEALASTLWDRLLPALGSIFEAVLRLWNALNPGLMMVIGAIAAIIGAVLVGAIWLWINVFNIVISVISFVINIVATLIGWLANLINWIGNVIGAAINMVSTIIGWFRKLPGEVGGVVNSVVGWFQGLPGRIGSALSGVGGAITAPFKAAFNAVAGFWNSTMGKIDFKLPDWVPGVGGRGFSLPKIPMLAQGALVTGPTFAGIGEGRESEAVLPLSRLESMMETWQRRLIAQNGGPTTTINRGDTVVNVYPQTAEATREVFRQLDNDTILSNTGLTPVRGGA